MILCRKRRFSAQKCAGRPVGVYSNLLCCPFLQLSLQCFDGCTVLTDNNTGFCCVYADLYSAGCSFDCNLGNACIVQSLLDEFSDFNVFYEVISKVFFCIPFCIPIFDDTYS